VRLSSWPGRSQLRTKSSGSRKRSRFARCVRVRPCKRSRRAQVLIVSWADDISCVGVPLRRRISFGAGC
jgi:hypothetical protein